jgi:hypothetical protein
MTEAELDALRHGLRRVIANLDRLEAKPSRRVARAARGGGES